MHAWPCAGTHGLLEDVHGVARIEGRDSVDHGVARSSVPAETHRVALRTAAAFCPVVALTLRWWLHRPTAPGMMLNEYMTPLNPATRVLELGLPPRSSACRRQSSWRLPNKRAGGWQNTFPFRHLPLSPLSREPRMNEHAECLACVCVQAAAWTLCGTLAALGHAVSTTLGPRQPRRTLVPGPHPAPLQRHLLRFADARAPTRTHTHSHVSPRTPRLKRTHRGNILSAAGANPIGPGGAMRRQTRRTRHGQQHSRCGVSPLACREHIPPPLPRAGTGCPRTSRECNRPATETPPLPGVFGALKAAARGGRGGCSDVSVTRGRRRRKAPHHAWVAGCKPVERGVKEPISVIVADHSAYRRCRSGDLQGGCRALVTVCRMWQCVGRGVSIYGRGTRIGQQGWDTPGVAAACARGKCCRSQVALQRSIVGAYSEMPTEFWPARMPVVASPQDTNTASLDCCEHDFAAGACACAGECVVF